MDNKERIAVFKDRLREALRHKEFKAIDLSESTGIPKGAISYYLAGKSTPKSDRLHVISVALDVSEAWLLGYDVPRERTIEQKKNDNLVKVIARLRKDASFRETVFDFAELSEEEAESIKQLLSVLRNK